MSEMSLINLRNGTRKFIVLPDSDSSLDDGFMSESDTPIRFHKTGTASKVEKLRTSLERDSGVYCCPSDSLESPKAHQRPQSSLTSRAGARQHKPARKARKAAVVRWKKDIEEDSPLEYSENDGASKTGSLRKPGVRRKRANTVEKIVSANRDGKTPEMEDKGDDASNVHIFTQGPLFCASTPRRQRRKRRKQYVEPSANGDGEVEKTVCKSSTVISPVRLVSKSAFVQRLVPESMLHPISRKTGEQAQDFDAGKAVVTTRESNSLADMESAAARPVHPFSSQSSSMRPFRRFRVVADDDSEPEDVPAAGLSALSTSCSVPISKTSAHRSVHADESVRDRAPPERRAGSQLSGRCRKAVDGAVPDQHRGSKRAAQTRAKVCLPTAKHRQGARKRSVKHPSEKQAPVKKTGGGRVKTLSPGRCRKAGDRTSRKNSQKPAGKPAQANHPDAKTRKSAKGERLEQEKAINGKRPRPGRTPGKRTQEKEIPSKHREETKKTKFWPTLVKKTPVKKAGLRKKPAALNKWSRKKSARATSATRARKLNDADSPKLPLVGEYFYV